MTLCKVQILLIVGHIYVNQLDNFTLVTDLNEQIGKG